MIKNYNNYNGKYVIDLKRKVNYLRGKCPICSIKLTNYNNELKFCFNCGTKLIWEEKHE